MKIYKIDKRRVFKRHHFRLPPLLLRSTAHYPPFQHSLDPRNLYLIKI